MDKRRRIQGVVFSNKNDKTIGVMLSGYKKHSKYLKRVQFRSKYYADDPKNEAKVGDLVTIEECRPISKTKRFKLVSIDQRALEKVEVKEEVAVEEALHEEVKPEEETKEEE
jgi:small subunit ribosomal protein S17